EKAALRVKLSPESFSMLHHTAHSQPSNGLIGNLGPRIVEISGFRCRVEDVFVVERKRQLLPGERSLTAGGDPVRPAKDPSDHGRDIELPGLAPEKVVSRPQ